MRGDSVVLLWELFFHVAKTHVLMMMQAVDIAMSPIWMFKSVWSYFWSEVVDGMRHVFGWRQEADEADDVEDVVCEKEVYYGKYLPQSIHKRFLRDDLVVVITDIVKSTSLWNLSPDAMYRTIGIHDDTARRLCRFHEGYEIRNEGDSFLFIFVDVRDALDFSVEFYREIKRISVFSRREQRKTPRQLPLELRIAINKGPVALRRDEFFGVHGDVVTETYGMLRHTDRICVSESLRASTGRFGKEIPFCIHNKGL